MLRLDSTDPTRGNRARRDASSHAGLSSLERPGPDRAGAGRAALRDAATVLPGMIPFGLLLGVTVVATGSGRWTALIGGAAVYGGSAQLSAITLLGSGAGLIPAVLTATLVNLRLLLYGAALGPRFADQPWWFRWLGPHLIIDQTYLMTAARPELAGRELRRYWGRLGGTVLLVWTGSIAAGIALAPAMPELPHLGLVATAMFVGLLVPRLSERPAVLAAATGAGVAAATTPLLPALSVILGALAGMLAGLAADRPRETRRD